MKRLASVVLSLLFFFGTIFPVNAIEGKVYEVPVDMMHQSEKPDKYSMGNEAINHTAIVKEVDGRYEYKLQYKPLHFMDIDGQITNLFVYSDHDAKIKYEVIGSNIQNGEFTKEYTFKRDNKDDRVWVAVWVDAMDEIAGEGVGSGEQDAYLLFHWDEAKEINLKEDKGKVQKQREKKVNEVPTKDITIEVNGKIVNVDVPPYIKNNRTMVPLRFISEELGLEVDWNKDNREVTIGIGDPKLVLTTGENTIMKNDGVKMEIDVESEIINGRTFVPIRAIAEIFNCKVGWNDETRTVSIENNK
ncbi:copper amine oxidase N-terminal domain-containing protein [Anaerosphaera multitolerans]|uniref:Copper amine oxidase N-terminal domain-containing protein n=1 Tax=Anaerosphaera multitolerans TaxID=2487351 RepID=A0A437S680_9FIRM|nr:stalk domain-containing protein [Anaerosphaera multitolerans]RVU54416.1 copper amine oxidase N-terminal domain-containing protein [Anaerosphaera multitolerans]